MIILRRTLNRPDEQGTKDIEITLSDGIDNNISFSEEKWDKVFSNMHVFNNYYIEDNVLVSKYLAGDAVSVGIISKEKVDNHFWIRNVASR